MHQTTPHALRRWISSGNGGAGGIVWKLKNAPTFRGSVGQELAVGGEQLVGVLDRPERRPADDVGHRDARGT